MIARTSFVTRAFVQEHGMGRLEPEMRSAHDELSRRGVPVELFLHKNLVRGRVAVQPDTLVVGEVPTVQLALRRLGIEAPGEPSYPEPLRPFLSRRIWPSTVDGLRSAVQAGAGPCFVKPRDRLKRFTGCVIESEADLFRLHGVSASAGVWCSEIVRFVSEHRVFVIDGRIAGTRAYDGDRAIALDMEVVRRAVETWTQSGAAAAGYGIDFGVLDDGRTVLVELNDGYALGSYVLDGATYVDLLVRRWEELTAPIAMLDEVDPG